MIIDGCKRTGLLATLLVGAMMCVPSAANADAIVTLSGPTSNAGMIDLSTVGTSKQSPQRVTGHAPYGDQSAILRGGCVPCAKAESPGRIVRASPELGKLPPVST
jgi:hypothetical protein